VSEIKHTPTPWKLQKGWSDWGMPCQHDIYVGEDGEPTQIAGIPSITPYCMGAKESERTLAATQAANAEFILEAVNNHDRLIGRVVELEKALNRIVSCPHCPTCPEVAKAALAENQKEAYDAKP
jgi:hypothetical protein